MQAWILAAVIIALTPLARAQSGEALLESKGCLGCHGVDEKKMGPALREAAAKYKGSEVKLIEALRAGKGHPMPVDASAAELQTILAYLQQKPPAKPKPEAAAAAPMPLDNATCLGCHGNEGFAMPGPDGRPRPLHVVKEKFELSVHAKRQCVECHTDITEIPHKRTGPIRVGCIQCHQDMWKGLEEDRRKDYERLGVVVEQIDRYLKSVHALPRRDDQSRTNATCYNCHDAHYIYPIGSTGRADWRLSIPLVCGKCHEKQREVYKNSVHGVEVLQKGNPVAAICSDCHTTHDIQRTAQAATKVAITQNCGNCHVESYRTYIQTYHGQVHRLGYAYTAKCSDCHSGHNVQRVSDPASRVHPYNRLATCQQCHKNATPGFVSFQPHATSHDFERYPQVWVATKSMVALLIGVFVFFWAHTALWFYREWRDRKEGKTSPHVVGLHLHPQGKQFQRFAPMWRLAHLVFAISVMTLVLTGMAVFFAEMPWAQLVVRMFGSPKEAAFVHRAAATIMLGIFFIHLVYVVGARILPRWRTFDWFGPNSLVPNWQDLQDIIAMFQWFLGMRPRPQFDRWTYWEKFDYWAVIGGSGMMLAFPEATASVLPGWIFNVATIVHGEEAVLAAVFLFTVHFFNNHFRPDKFPLDIVMFTGSVSLDEFRREHALEYERLKKSGELEKHLVDAPSRPLTIGSAFLGFVLIMIGLLLLVLVLRGFLVRAG
jgi:cytochrome c551/c552/thiosulfate reductase cytochrome b subunit